MLKVDDNSKVMKKIRGARSLKDLTSILMGLTSTVEDISKDADALLKTVSANLKMKVSISAKLKGVTKETLKKAPKVPPKVKKGARGLDDIQPTGTPAKKEKAKPLPTFVKNFKQPNLKELVKDSKQLANIAQRIFEIERLRLALLGDTFSSLPSTKDIMKSTEKALKEIRDAQKTHQKAMQLSIKDKPREVKTFSKNILKYVSELPEEDFSRLTPKSFILHPNSKEIWYQTFIVMEDLVVANDFIFDMYIYVATSIVQLEDGEMKNYLTSIKGEAIPASFDIGKHVPTTAAAKRHINALLSADNYHIQKSGGKSLETTEYPTTESLIAGNVLKSSPHVKKVRIHKNNIYFRLHQGVDKLEIAEALARLKTGMQNLYSGDLTGKSSLSHKIVRTVNKNAVMIIFSLSPYKAPSEKMMQKIEQFAKQFDVNEATTFKLKQFMVKELD